MKRREIAQKWLTTIMLGLIGLIMVTPLVWMLSASFKYETDVFAMPIEWIPSNPILTNYVTVFTDFPFLAWYKNTFIVAISVVLVVLVFSSVSGYAFAKLTFAGKNFIFALFIATMMIPAQVRIIPQFMVFKQLSLINTLGAVILPWSFNAFAIFLMRQFFSSIPNDLIEAARIDGCNEYSTFFRIVLPQASSQLAALTILAFTWGWNDYFGPLVYISDTTKQVLSVGIASIKGNYSSNYAIQMAGATLALIPILIVYVCAQKHFIEGIATSGIKG